MSSAPQVLLIDGIDGSGKSIFAERWTGKLHAHGTRVVLLHVDDVRCPVDWTSAADEADLYWTGYFDLAKLDEQIAQMNGRSDLILVEGIFTLRLACADVASLVYLEVGYDQCAQRVLERDTALGRTADDVRYRIETRYFPAQRRYREAFRPAERAAVLIDNSLPQAGRLTRADWSRIPECARVTLEQLLA